MMDVLEPLRRLLRLRPKVKEIRLAPNLAQSSAQFGDRVRVLPDPSTEAKGFVGKVGTVYGQTTVSITNPTVIGTPTKDYAVNVFLDDLNEQFWFAEHLLELVDHGAGAAIILKGVDRKWTRNAEGRWDESSR
jgi:ribosomal protein L21E